MLFFFFSQLPRMMFALILCSDSCAECFCLMRRRCTYCKTKHARGDLVSYTPEAVSSHSLSLRHATLTTQRISCDPHFFSSRS